MLTFVAYTAGLLSLACDFVNPFVGVFGCLFKGVLLFVLGMGLINANLRVRALSNEGEGSLYQSFGEKGVMAEEDARRLSVGVVGSVVVLIRVVVVLLVACSTVLNGLLYFMVARYPKELSLSPVDFAGKPWGPALFVAGLSLAVVSAVLFWKVAAGIKRAVTERR